ncbi:MAG: hypothetical protein H6686_03470 [Fibrobacteria bacterium]|nr:hypothetical protein [Fibrobacteria bacterium]
MALLAPPPSHEVLVAIHQALQANPSANGVHISIEPHAREIQHPDRSTSWMKALCWNLLRDGEPLGEEAPELALVAEHHNDDSLRAEVARFFPGYDCRIDHEILIEEED